MSQYGKITGHERERFLNFLEAVRRNMTYVVVIGAEDIQVRDVLSALANIRKKTEDAITDLDKVVAELKLMDQIDD